MRRREVGQMQWEWPMTNRQDNHRERVALLRPIPYEVTAPVEGETASVGEGRALSINISSGGMLVLMELAPEVEQVLKVFVPTPVMVAETPTLAEVRWTRRLPFGKTSENGAYFVGLKFIL